MSLYRAGRLISTDGALPVQQVYSIRPDLSRETNLVAKQYSQHDWHWNVFAGEGNPKANIVDALLFASTEGMEHQDFRVLSVLCSWLGVHARWINADRLVQIASAHASARVRFFWAAFAVWLKKDRRFVRLQQVHEGPRQDLLEEGTEFQIRRFGEDPRFEGGPLRIDSRILRDRTANILSPRELAERHRAYRWRVIMGPSYRADMWAELESDDSISVSELARRTYSSIGAAWEAHHDYRTLRAAPREAPSSRGSILVSFCRTCTVDTPDIQFA